jgi:DNA-binding MarR family transcriptional regulator
VFEASWFPVFYLLSKNESLSIKELSEQIEISHPAASQLITGLKNKKLVTSATCTDDGRRQLVQLTDSGNQLLTQVIPVWEAVTVAMEDLVSTDPGCKDLLPAITALENTFRSANLANMIGSKLKTEVQ